jgi:ankyrin repeat protein
LSRAGDNLLHVLLNDKHQLEFGIDNGRKRKASEEVFLKVTQILVDGGCNIDAPNLEGSTPLDLAITLQVFSVIQYLIAKGVKIPNNAIPLALRYTWQIGVNPRVFHLLLQHGADPNMLSDQKYNNPLHSLLNRPVWSWPTQENILETMDILIKHGCKFDAPNAEGHTPLHYAIERQCPSIIQFLLDKGSQLPSDAIHIALMHMSSRTPMILHMLILCGLNANGSSNIDKRNNTLHTLLSKGCLSLAFYLESKKKKDIYLECVQILIDSGCEFDTAGSDGITPVHLAARLGLTSVVQYLVDKGACIHNDAIHIALGESIEEDACSIVSILLQHGADANALWTNGNNPVHTLLNKARVEHCCLDITQLLVDHGCPFDTPDHEGITPLQHAAMKQLPSVVKYLLQKGACCPSNAIQTALSTKFGVGYINNISPGVIYILLQHGADAKILTSEGNNLLHIFLGLWHDGDSSQAEMMIVQNLVELGCEFDAANCNGDTPLDIATMQQHYIIIKWLIDKGAHCKSDVLHTALLVNQDISVAVIELHVLHGADVNYLLDGGNNPLHTLFRGDINRSSEQVCLKIAQILIDAGCNFTALNERKQTPLCLAARKQFPSVVKYLLDKGAHVHPDDLIEVFDSTESINSTIIHLLLQHGVNATLTSLSYIGNNALHSLLDVRRYGDTEDTCLEIAHALVDAGFDFKAENLNGVTPLKLAVDRQYPSLVAYLLDKGAQFSDTRYMHPDNLTWAMHLPWHGDAVDAGCEALKRRSLTPQDLVQTKHLLQLGLGLPFSITQHILDAAEYFGCVSIIDYNIKLPRELSVKIPNTLFRAEIELQRIVFSIGPRE